MMMRFVVFASLAWVLAGSAGAEAREAVQVPGQQGRTLSGVLFLPDGRSQAPGVVVLHTAYGSVESFDEDYARTLAKEGFVALAVNYMPGSRRWAPRITADLTAVVNYLRQRSEVSGRPVGTVGFSLGGGHGLLLAARHPGVKAVVAYYGAYDPRKLRAANLPPDIPTPIDVASEVNAAVLLLHGDADDEVPVSIARDMKSALDAAGKTVELVTYPGAYHRFDRGPIAQMTGMRNRGSYTYRKDSAAANDAFERTVAWLKKYLQN